QNPPVDPSQINWWTAQLPQQLGQGDDGPNGPTHPNGTDPTQEQWYAWKVYAQINLVNQRTATVNADIAALTGPPNPDHPILNPLLQPIPGTDLVLKATNMP